MIGKEIERQSGELQETLPACPRDSHSGKGRLSSFTESKIRKPRLVPLRNLPYHNQLIAVCGASRL